MRNPRQAIGALLRNIATAAVLLAERVDPQPPITLRSFTIYGDGSYSDTTASLGTVKWNRTG